MRTVIENLLEYELIEPITRFMPQGPIVSIEINPVKEDGNQCEPCAAGEEDFWSVYVRYDPARSSHGFGGVDCVADCANYTGAEKLADLLAALLGVEVVQP